MRYVLAILVLALVLVTGVQAQQHPSAHVQLFNRAFTNGVTYYSPSIPVSGFDSLYIRVQVPTGDSASVTFSLDNYAPGQSAAFFNTSLDTVVRSAPAWAGQGHELLKVACPRGVDRVVVKAVAGASGNGTKKVLVWAEVIKP